MSDRRSAFIAVIGAPNAGKSTLVNALVGAKISIVTQKIQTTRMRVRGIAIDGDTQIVLIDTPGIFSPRRRLDRSMVAAAWEAIEGADAIVLIVDSTEYAKSGAWRRSEPDDAAVNEALGESLRPYSKSVADTEMIIEELKKRSRKCFLVLNKIDKVARPRLLKMIGEMNAHNVFEETLLISAETGDGVADLRKFLISKALPSEWFYPADQLSDISERVMAAEITREKIFKRLHQELPYESTVETTGWMRTKKGELKIEQTIYVSRESHRPIVLGKGGQTLKAIGEASRKELMDLMGEPIHLFLTVNVREGWTEETARYSAMGLCIVK